MQHGRDRENSNGKQLRHDVRNAFRAATTRRGGTTAHMFCWETSEEELRKKVGSDEKACMTGFRSEAS